MLLLTVGTTGRDPSTGLLPGSNTDLKYQNPGLVLVPNREEAVTFYSVTFYLTRFTWSPNDPN